MSDGPLPPPVEILPFNEWFDNAPEAVRLSDDYEIGDHYETYFFEITHFENYSSPSRFDQVIGLLSELATIFGFSSWNQFEPLHLSFLWESYGYAEPLTADTRFDLRLDFYRRILYELAELDGEAWTMMRHLNAASEQYIQQHQQAREAGVERGVTEEEVDENCNICLEQLEEGEVVRVLPCVGHSGHWFHTDCIQAWFLQSGDKSCPFRCEQRAAIASQSGDEE